MATNGCFDLLHPGHVHLLEQARSWCDRLVVGLDPAGEVVVRAADGRRLANPDLFRPSRRLVRQVLTEFENRFFVWSDPAALARRS